MGLKINADDFGASKEINEGTIMAFKAKAITNASIINGPEKEHAIRLAKKHKIPCGVHLRKEGIGIYQTGPVYAIFLKSLLSKKFRYNLEKEFEKQIIEIKNEIKVSHLDSHMHIHMFPPIFNIVAKLAKKYDLRVRLSRKIEISLFNKLGLMLFYPINKKKALKEGVDSIDSYETKVEKLNNLILNKRKGEIVVHPGTRDEKKVKRRKELDILLKNMKK